MPLWRVWFFQPRWARRERPPPRAQSSGRLRTMIGTARKPRAHHRAPRRKSCWELKLAEVGLAHLVTAHDLVGSAIKHHHAEVEKVGVGGERLHELDVVLDEQDGEALMGLDLQESLRECRGLPPVES